MRVPKDFSAALRRPANRAAKQLVASEDSHQIALFQMIEASRARYPDLRWAHAVPNGGLRSKATAGKMKAAGVKAGVPDLSLPLRRGDCSGLYIELKRPAAPGKRAGTTNPQQREWIAFLRTQGFRVEVAFGWEHAWEILKDYHG